MEIKACNRSNCAQPFDFLARNELQSFMISKIRLCTTCGTTSTKERSMMTSASRRLNLGVLFASAATILTGSTFAFGQQQGYVSPSPFGSTSRLAGTNFANGGLTSVGFQNTGFLNTGFQNSGFRNYSPSVSGLRVPSRSSYTPYAPGGMSNLNN